MSPCSGGHCGDKHLDSLVGGWRWWGGGGQGWGDFHAMRESRKTPGNVSMFWRALWGQTLRQSSGWVEVVGGGGRAGGIFMP